MALGVDTGSAESVVLDLAQWNQTQQNATIYLWTAIILPIVIIGLLFLFRGFWPVIIAKWSAKNPLNGILGKDNRIEFVKDLQIVNGMLYYKGEAEPFVKIYPGNWFFTGAPWQLFHMDLKILDDPRYKLLKKRIQSLGYPNIDFLEEGLMFSAMKYDDPRAHEIMRRHGLLHEEKWIDDEGKEQIQKLSDDKYLDLYNSARRILNPANLNYKSVEVRPFFESIQLVDLMGENFDGYGEEPSAESLLGETDDRYQEMRPSEVMKRKISSLMPMGILAIVICGIIALAWKMFF